MNEPEQKDRLPVSVGGLVGFAAAAYAERAPLYLGLALLDIAIAAVVQLLRPDNIAFFFAGQIVGDALVIGAVALGVGSRAAGETAPIPKLFETAIARWGDVAGAYGLAVVLTAYVVQPVALPFGGIDAFGIVAAPMAWLMLGALSLAGPVTALGTDRPILAILTGFWRALALGLRLVNLPRLLFVSLAVTAVILLQTLAGAILKKAGVAHLDFWANAPIDALLCGPLTALQTAFVLDFARRLRATPTPPPR